ncbi:MAG: phosphatase PAP2 family protein [Bacteroidales bacterium]|nr:phosphatase PAP2 family protein [Bacteroidales bacterium]
MSGFDTTLFQWINSHHCTVADWVLWCASQGWSWAVVLLAVFVICTLRREPGRWWLVLAGIALCFLFADQLSATVFKPGFCRLRPCHALPDVRMFRTGCGGMYGFISSHAANVVACATFLAMRYRKAALSWLMALWCLVVCYSRPYLGKHYPGDVVAGALVGFAIGATVCFIAAWAEGKITSSSTK